MATAIRVEDLDSSGDELSASGEKSIGTNSTCSERKRQLVESDGDGEGTSGFSMKSRRNTKKSKSESGTSASPTDSFESDFNESNADQSGTNEFRNDGFACPAETNNEENSDTESRRDAERDRERAMKDELGKWVCSDVKKDGYSWRFMIFQDMLCTFEGYKKLDRCLDCHERANKNGSQKDDEEPVCRFRYFRKFKNRDGVHSLPEKECRFSDQTEQAFEKGRKTTLDFLLPRWTELDGTNGGFAEYASYYEPTPAFHILRFAKVYFLRLIEEERRFLELLEKEYPERNPRWKFWKSHDNTKDVRETCDVCSTTIFNVHLFCECCGFSACRTCVKERMEGNIRGGHKGAGRDRFGWKYCPSKNWRYCIVEKKEDRMHCPNKMPLAYIVPGPDPSNILSCFDVMEDWISHEIETWTKLSKRFEAVVGSAPVNEKLARWFFEKQLLYLDQSINEDSSSILSLFQRQWQQSRPVIVGNIHDYFCREPRELWHPDEFSSEFRGIKRSDQLIDCRTGLKCANVSLEEFWNGFMDRKQRAKNKYGGDICLKLKDFPPQKQFSAVFPKHFEDFCSVLPIKEYTNPVDGIYNLATKLPKRYVPPDLGPKMYTAYEMTDRTKGTTNLHLDMSDAVNILMNVTLPKNVDEPEFYKNMIEYLEKQELDEADLARAKSRFKNVGALWTIFKPEHNSKIRMFLNKLTKENRDTDDPIHNQKFYLHLKLRKRLEKEYGIKGFTFVQMLGDAVFIPAGAAHQVQNLQCCIKMAEDFVSAEGVRQCAVMTEEFRALGHDYDNHEDKLQLANIVANSVAQVLHILRAANCREPDKKRGYFFQMI